MTIFIPNEFYNYWPFLSWTVLSNPMTSINVFFKIWSSNLSCHMLTTTSSVNSSLPPSILWNNKQVLLGYCSWSSLTFSNDLTLSFRPLTYFKLFFIFSVSLQYFSKSSNFSDISLTDCVRLSQIVKLFIAFNLHGSRIVAKIIYLWYFHF